jgi:hypothetical protein
VDLGLECANDPFDWVNLCHNIECPTKAGFDHRRLSIVVFVVAAAVEVVAAVEVSNNKNEQTNTLINSISNTLCTKAG